MSHYTVLLDANVLYPAPLRDALMQLVVTDLLKAKWTADIHQEWIGALLRNQPHRNLGPAEAQEDSDTGDIYKGGGIELRIVNARQNVRFMRHGSSGLTYPMDNLDKSLPQLGTKANA